MKWHKAILALLAIFIVLGLILIYASNEVDEPMLSEIKQAEKEYIIRLQQRSKEQYGDISPYKRIGYHIKTLEQEIEMSNPYRTEEALWFVIATLEEIDIKNPSLRTRIAKNIVIIQEAIKEEDWQWSMRGLDDLKHAYRALLKE